MNLNMNIVVMVPVAAPMRKRAYEDPNLDPQSRVVMEVIETEEDYCRDLQTIIDVCI